MYESAKIFSGTATRYLSEKIAASSGERLGEVTISRFSDGEFQPSFEETVRGELETRHPSRGFDARLRRLLLVQVVARPGRLRRSLP